MILFSMNFEKLLLTLMKINLLSKLPLSFIKTENLSETKHFKAEFKDVHWEYREI